MNTIDESKFKRIVEQMPPSDKLTYYENGCMLFYKNSQYVDVRSRLESLCEITSMKPLFKLKENESFSIGIGKFATIDDSMCIIANSYFKKNITAGLQGDLQKNNQIYLISPVFLEEIRNEVKNKDTSFEGIKDKCYMVKDEEQWVVVDNMNNDFFQGRFNDFDVALGYFSTKEVDQYEIEKKLLHDQIYLEAKADYSDYDRECFESLIDYYHQKDVDYETLKDYTEQFINNSSGEWLPIEEKHISDLVDDNLEDFSSEFSYEQLQNIKSAFIPYFMEEYNADYFEISNSFDHFADNMKLLKEKKLINIKSVGTKESNINGLFEPHDDDNTLGNIVKSWNLVRLDNEKQFKKMEYDLNAIKQGIRIEDYASSLGFHVMRVGSYLTLEEHDSVRIDPKENKFWRNSTGASGSIIDFIVEFEGKDKNQAIRELQAKLDPNFDLSQVKDYGNRKKQSFRLFLKDKDDVDSKRVHSYLNQRGIDNTIIDELLEKRMLYQGVSKECVFIGYNERGLASWSSARGTGNKKYFCEAPGSDYSVGWYINNSADTTVIVEGCIDALSYMSLKKREGIDHKTYNYLALGSVNKIAIGVENAKTYKPDKFITALDNDSKGIKAAIKLKGMLQEAGFNNIENQVSNRKDWNDDLVNSINKESSRMIEQSERTFINFEYG